MQTAIADALSHPEHYVVKPQREGGGNNLFGADVAAALQCVQSSPGQQHQQNASMTQEELAGYILMERVFPRAEPAVFLRNGKTIEVPAAISELGVYSVLLSRGDGSSPPLLSAAAGHLLRTKAVGSDEGGVAAGYAVLDSPHVV